MTEICDLQDRFNNYIERLSQAIIHKDRKVPLHDYLFGLCLPGGRKSIEPMAARVDPTNVQAKHESLHHLVAKSPWKDEAVLHESICYALERIEDHGGVEAWIVDDTGIRKKGNLSVGVARQYCGNIGKVDNCQNAVSVSLANELISIPAAYRLYLPEVWANNRQRCEKVGVPPSICFQTKWQIALDQIQSLQAKGYPQAPLLADAGYGNITMFREKLTEWEIPYIVGIDPETTVWEPNKGPLLPKAYSGRGRPPTLLRRTDQVRPISSMKFALSLPDIAWQTISWREGTKGVMKSRFSAMRVRPAHDDEKRDAPRPTEWLLVEWPPNTEKPTRFWLSTLPEDVPFDQMVRLAKMRWRIERDYEDLKGELGLDHYEGRNWRGFHHHATLCIAAYAFIANERMRFPPLGIEGYFKAPQPPENFKPRGSPMSSTTA